MRQSRRTEGTYQKPKKQTVAFASTKKADSTRLRFVTHLHPRFRLSCNHYTRENLFRKDKEKQKSNICSCFYFFLLHLPLQSCIYFFIQRLFFFCFHHSSPLSFSAKSNLDRDGYFFSSALICDIYAVTLAVGNSSGSSSENCPSQ